MKSYRLNLDMNILTEVPINYLKFNGTTFNEPIANFNEL